MVYSGDEIQAMAVHATSDRFVVGTSHSKDFKLPDDELHPEWSVESERRTSMTAIVRAK